MRECVDRYDARNPVPGGQNVVPRLLDDLDARDRERAALRDLLAVIFQDGGHRSDEIGCLVKSCEEAEGVVIAEGQNIHAQHERIAALEAENERLRAALEKMQRS